MVTKKHLHFPYNSPEEKLLSRILFQAVEDAYSLPSMTDECHFENRRLELWGFFNSSWFYEILDILDISPHRKIWKEVRDLIWECKTCREK